MADSGLGDPPEGKMNWGHPGATLGPGLPRVRAEPGAGHLAKAWRPNGKSKLSGFICEMILILSYLLHFTTMPGPNYQGDKYSGDRSNTDL